MFDLFYGGFWSIFTIIAIVFIIIIGVIVVRVVFNIKQWKSNNESPVLTVDAKIVTKRANVEHFHHHNAGTNDIGHSSSSTTYYVTFEVGSGDRMEFRVRSSEYGMLAENDNGKLTFQGTRYLQFERNFKK